MTLHSLVFINAIFLINVIYFIMKTYNENRDFLIDINEIKLDIIS